MDTPSLNRREFMKRGIAVSAAFGIPTIVPSLVFGENAPSNRVNVGLVGCGNIGNYHKNWLKQYPDTRIVAVADAYKSRRVAMAEEMNKHYESADTTKVYDDFREVIAHPEVDAIFIGAHDNWHTPMAIAAARAGKDIYCQKPLTLDLEHAKLLRQAVAENSRIFQFGTQYRSESLYPKMVELVRNGYIGEVQRIDVWSRNVLNDTNQYHVAPYGSSEEIPVPEDLDFNVWQGPSPMVPYTADRCTPWGGYHCPETSLGFVAGCAIHPLGVAQWGNRSDHTSPIRYEGTGKVPAEGIFRTLERWDILCDYENGVKLHMMDMETATDVVKTYYPKLRNGDGVVFHGTEGWIGDFNFGTFYASNQKLWKEELKPDDERVYKSDGHVRNFIDCVKSRKETVCPVEMAIRCDTIAHMVNVAAQTGRVINWDPKAEQIVGDEEAAKMLTRSCREEWKIW
ncbi:MAG TPA: Gfo/Idh/MocA family oxidoreductase [Candidatus Hydrogenedentes bacterium]|nr:Gfo/Idh/MocA family oxidoreductase [Candidatus Hydrogenedentota bacterium]HQM99672.1 Gfo/Idh/MocA family oxidoreductase [Candidatus Hydrogenedentota bacterium]